MYGANPSWVQFYLPSRLLRSITQTVYGGVVALHHSSSCQNLVVIAADVMS